MKKVLVICATSIATSTAVAMKIKDICKANSINVEVKQAKGQEYYSRGNKFTEGYDLVLTTVAPISNPKTPTLHGSPLITGIGEEELIVKIIDILKINDKSTQ